MSLVSHLTNRFDRSAFALILVATTIHLTGCDTIPVGDEPVQAPAIAEQYASQIVRGVTTQEQLRQEWGEPLVTNSGWRIDVFRKDLADVWGAIGLAFIPVPIPAYFTLDDKAYLLVTYGQDWVVSDFGTGAFVESESVVRDEIRQTGQEVNVRVDDFVLRVVGTTGFQPKNEWLLAPVDLSTRALGTTSDSQDCLINLALELLGWEWPLSGWGWRLRIDGRSIVEDRNSYPSQLAGKFEDAFLQLQVSPGDHLLEVVPSGSLLWNKGKIAQYLTCTPPTVYFMSIDVQEPERSIGSIRLDGSIRITDSATSIFDGRRLLLYNDERWLGPTSAP